MRSGEIMFSASQLLDLIAGPVVGEEYLAIPIVPETHPIVVE